VPRDIVKFVKQVWVAPDQTSAKELLPEVVIPDVCLHIQDFKK
jgi:hypothetical protein